ncbi:hypothetical protein AMTR_s00112p00123140 [Amborella trichopoda]|uniref:Uncharacterized protein n=1 Tax=Amborella trichopoda TaxID=13333 RepID=W1NZJ4_AMBTC|nr:hypothetical protein AMTR_s00112p00123140 [Amborella trichopoda]
MAVEDYSCSLGWRKWWTVVRGQQSERGLIRGGGDSGRHLVLMMRGGRKSELGTRGREGSSNGCLYWIEKGGWKCEEKKGSWVVLVRVAKRDGAAMGCCCSQAGKTENQGTWVKMGLLVVDRGIRERWVSGAWKEILAHGVGCEERHKTMREECARR